MRKLVVKILNIFSKRIISRYKPVIIGVSGSVGKSSACQVIEEILSTKYEVRLNNSSYRTDISIPLAIIGADSGKQSVSGWISIFRKAITLILGKSNFYPDILILEMGVDRPGDMENMLKIIRPDIAVLTGIGEFPSHVKYFKNEKALIREKSLLLKSLRKKDLAIFNIDDDRIVIMADKVVSKKVSFGFSESAGVRGEEIFLGNTKWKIESGKIGMSFKITYEGTVIPFRFSYALGRGQIYAALAGTAVALHFGFNMVEISEALVNHKALPGRMNLIKGFGGSIIVDDTFNANPGSFKVALEAVNKLEAQRKIIVIGDMRELGELTKKAYKKVSSDIVKVADMILCFEKDKKYFYNFLVEENKEDKTIYYFDDKKELVDNLKNILKNGDIVLVKGARAERMEKIVRGIMLEPELADEILVK